MAAKTPEDEFFELAATKDKVAEVELEAVFDRLKPVAPAALLGEWNGHGFETEHPTHQQLRSLRWAGKNFRSVYDVDPMMVYNEEGHRVWDPRFGHAQIREVKHREVVTAAMFYDKAPIIDVFRYVDVNTVIGAMDHKDTRHLGTYYFYLTRRPLKSRV